MNPYQYGGRWWWSEAEGLGVFDLPEGKQHGPYDTEEEALRRLLRWLAPPWYARLLVNIRRFWNDTRGTR